MLFIFFSIVGLVALYAQSITSHPTLPFSNDDAGLSSADLVLDPANQFSTVGSTTNPPPGELFPAPDASSSEDAETPLSQEVALNDDDDDVSSSALAPPAPMDSQESLDPGCDKGSKGKRDTGGGGAGKSCPAIFPTNLSPPPAAQKKNPEGQQQEQQEPTNANPREPGSTGDLQFTPSDEPVRSPFGEKDKEPQCPPHYRYTVCGIIQMRYSTGASPLTVYDADPVINSGFGYGMVVRPGKKLITTLPPLFFPLVLDLGLKK